jgi:hypothetical protein
MHCQALPKSFPAADAQLRGADTKLMSYWRGLLFEALF